MSIRQAYCGWRLLWDQVPERRRTVIKALWVMWLNTSWVTALATWNQIENSRRSQICFAVGVALSSTVLFIMTCRVYNRAKREWKRDE